MKLSLFDLHCDTAFRMLTEKQPLERNTFAVSLEKSEGFAQYIQVMALWIDRRLTDDEGWSSFWSMLKNLQNDPASLNERAHLTTFCPERSGKPSLLLSLEDARILGGDLSRVEQLYEAGIRILTPLWAGVTCIGGAHNTQEGLTPFGRQALSRAISLGMIPDLSHASVESAKEILSIAEELHSPVIASHSNAYTICPVSRNLRDGQIRELLRLGGLIGLNFYTGFLKKDASATAASVFEHIDHFLTLGAEQSLALGGDMDGCDLPKDLPDLSALPALAEQMLSHNYSEQLVRAIFFENAFAFAQKHLQ
jgi:membrane dipeptidase